MGQSVDIAELRRAVRAGKVEWQRHALERMVERGIGRAEVKAMRKRGSPCPVCGGVRRLGATTFTVELGFGVVVVRNVPASVCSQCGADWLDDKVAARMENLVAEAKAKRSQVEVMALR